VVYDFVNAILHYFGLFQQIPDENYITHNSANKSPPIRELQKANPARIII